MELPLKKWTRDYKTFLEELAQADEIDEIKEYHKDNTVRFVLIVPGLKKLETQEGGILKKFKLTSTVSVNNMVLFDQHSRIKKYETEVQILEEFYPIRFNLYQKRKQHILKVLRAELDLLSNKCRFIESVNSGEIVLANQSKEQIIHTLETKGFAKLASGASSDKADEDSSTGSFEYLLSMQLWSLSKERVAEMRRKIEVKTEEVK